MFSLSHDFSIETVVLSIICKGVEIEIKPVKRISFNILVLHLVVKLRSEEHTSELQSL